MTSRRPTTATTVGCASVAVFLVALEMTVLSVALPAIAASFPEASRVALSWVFTAYNVTVAAGLLTAGWLAERFGRRRVFSIGLVVFGLGSLACALATTLGLLQVARAIQAVGGALAIPASLALVMASTTPARRDAAIAVWSAMAGLAAAVGPTLGGLLVAGAGWRWVFAINVPVALLAALIGWRALPESRGSVNTVDPWAAPLAAGGVGLLVLAIVAPRALGAAHPGTIVSAAASFTCLAAFVRRSVTHPAPVFDPTIARQRSFAASSGAMVAFVAAFSGWLVLAPTFLHELWGYPVLHAGFAIAPAPLLMAVSARPAGRAVSRFGHRRLIAVASALGCLACAFWLARVGSQPHYWLNFFPGTVLLGLAVGIGFPLTTAAALRNVPPHQYAMGAAGNTTLRQIAMAIGIAIAAVCVGPPGSGLAGFRTSWLVCAVLFGISGAVILGGLPALRFDRGLGRPRAGLQTNQEKLHV